MKNDTIILTRSQVAELLTLKDCINAVEQAFKLYTQGKASPPEILGLHTLKGGFHIKAGLLNLKREYFVAKANANYPENPRINNLPTIQGVVVVSDAENGRLLALLDSIELTIIRTGAATAVAAKYLSIPEATRAAIIGCGEQGRISIRMLMQVRPLQKIHVYDVDQELANNFAQEFRESLSIAVIAAESVEEAVAESEIVITCTPSKKAFLSYEHVSPGTFIAAVGADNEEKRELHTNLMSESKVVTDITRQCASIGELHHAMEEAVITKDHVYAELGEIIAGQKKGRVSKNEVIIFDSTGMALQDVAAAAIVYENALERKIGLKVNFNN